MTENSNQDVKMLENIFLIKVADQKIGKISLDYYHKIRKLIFESQTIPCLHCFSFCQAAPKHPYTSVWFPEETCLIFHNSDLIARMSKLKNRYWLQTDDFFKNIVRNTEV